MQAGIWLLLTSNRDCRPAFTFCLATTSISYLITDYQLGVAKRHPVAAAENGNHAREGPFEDRRQGGTDCQRRRQRTITRAQLEEKIRRSAKPHSGAAQQGVPPDTAARKKRSRRG